MISVSDVNLTFETNDGPVNDVKEIWKSMKEIFILYWTIWMWQNNSS